MMPAKVLDQEDKLKYELFTWIQLKRKKMMSCLFLFCLRVYVCAWDAIVFNTTFDNISVIFGGLVLLVEETRVPGENRRPVASH
jgi:hypothetical protein